jgi:polysaccharide biosynthesis transport protein
VVLIDLALQSPNLAAISTEPSAPGMAELVRGAASFRHIITRDRASHVHLVAAGRVPADASTVIRSERVVTAMNALTQTYDRVIVDAGAMPDAMLERLARIAPHAVLVAPGAGDEVTAPARDHLLAAGFNDVTVFRDTPPRPDAASGPDTAAA